MIQCILDNTLRCFLKFIIIISESDYDGVIKTNRFILPSFFLKKNP